MSDDLPDIAAFLADADPTCPRCLGGGLVCEDHPNNCWPYTDCDCPIGMPCPCTGTE